MKIASLFWIGWGLVFFGCMPRSKSKRPEPFVLPDSLYEFCGPTKIPAHQPPPSDSMGSNTAMLQGFGGLDVALLPQMPFIEALLWRRCGWKVESDGLIGSLKIDSHYDVHAIRVQKPGSGCSPTAICEPCEAYMKLSLSGKPICLACYGCPGPTAQPPKTP
jgi:hypothetical protein